jgi:hypothetical protein
MNSSQNLEKGVPHLGVAHLFQIKGQFLEGIL